MRLPPEFSSSTATGYSVEAPGAVECRPGAPRFFADGSHDTDVSRSAQEAVARSPSEAEINSMTETRVERDTMGEVVLPAEALYGAQTQRAVENFPISGQPMPPEFIRALGLVKLAAARVNRELGLLPPDVADAIERCRTRRGRWGAGRRVPDRRLPDRIRNVVEHERQRGDRRGRLGRAGPEGPPERRGQSGAVVQRRDPDRAARFGGAGDRERADPGAAASSQTCWSGRPRSSTTW